MRRVIEKLEQPARKSISKALFISMSSPGPTAGKYAPFETWTICCHSKGHESNAHNKVWCSLAHPCSNSKHWCHIALPERGDSSTATTQIALTQLGNLETAVILLLPSGFSSRGCLPDTPTPFLQQEPLCSLSLPLHFEKLSVISMITFY